MKSSTKRIICPQYRTKYCYNECNWYGDCPDLDAGDQLTEDEAICTSCGLVLERRMMFNINPGRKPVPLCPECYLKAQSRISGFEINGVNKLVKKRRVK